MPKMNYFTVGSNKLDQAKAFYDTLLGTVGMGPAYEHPSGGRVYASGEGAMFAVLGPFNGQAASAGNGSMAGFGCESREQVDAFYNKAMELGATDDGAPGERSPGVYFAYFRDLDGNKLCAYKVG
jgi:catechol 2,3-dioxygenase-like lactoylglutathione lyase family enzyme